MAFLDDLFGGLTYHPPAAVQNPRTQNSSDSQEAEKFIRELVARIFHKFQDKRYSEMEPDVNLLASVFGMEVPPAPLVPPPKTKLISVLKELGPKIVPLKDKARELRLVAKKIVEEDATYQTLCKRVTPILIDYNNQVASYNEVIAKIEKLKAYIKDNDTPPLTNEEIKRFSQKTGEKPESIVKKVKSQIEILAKKKLKLETFLNELKPFEESIKLQDNEIVYLIQCYERRGDYTARFRLNTGLYTKSDTTGLPPIPALEKRAIISP